jgi:hypothetical protein
MRKLLIPLVLCTSLCLLASGCHSAPSTATPQPAKPVVAATAAPVITPPTPLVCKGFSKDDAQGAGFVEGGALFVLMQSKLGGWTSCQNKKISKTDEVTTVTFPHGGILTISQYPSSDATTEEAVLDAGSGLTRDDVIKALKQDNPADGCGVTWTKLSAGGAAATGDFKDSGTTCSLDVHIKMANGSIVGFGFGIAV